MTGLDVQKNMLTIERVEDEEKGVQLVAVPAEASARNPRAPELGAWKLAHPPAEEVCELVSKVLYSPDLTCFLNGLLKAHLFGV